MAKPGAELKKAVGRGDVEAVRRIVAEGVDVNAPLPAKVTALEFALAKEQREVVEALLELGATPQPRKRDNLLLDVPKFRVLALLQRLIDLGADPHAADKSGRTPFAVAVEAGFHAAAEFLLDLGADPLVRTKEGRSVRQLANGTRRFCSELLPSSDGELAELFRSQLDDLDRIDAMLAERLPAAEFEALADYVRPPEPSTFWQFGDSVEFALEITPFPFTLKRPSTLVGRLGRHAERWESRFREQDRVEYRVRTSDDAGDWSAFDLDRREGGDLVFVATVRLPTGRTTIDLRFVTTLPELTGDVHGWDLAVG